MGSLGTTPLIVLFLGVAIAAALCGFVAANVVHRKARRTRRVFLVGVFCGLVAGEIVRVHRRGRKALAAITRPGPHLTLLTSRFRAGPTRQRARRLRL